MPWPFLSATCSFATNSTVFFSSDYALSVLYLFFSFVSSSMLLGSLFLNYLSHSCLADSTISVPHLIVSDFFVPYLFLRSQFLNWMFPICSIALRLLVIFSLFFPLSYLLFICSSEFRFRAIFIYLLLNPPFLSYLLSICSSTMNAPLFLTERQVISYAGKTHNRRFWGVFGGPLKNPEKSPIEVFFQHTKNNITND